MGGCPSGRQGRCMLAAVIMLVFLAGCGGSDDLLGANMPDDGPPPATAPASAKRLLEKVTVAGEAAAETGWFSLTATEGEVTSYLQIVSLLRWQLTDLGDGGLQEIEAVLPLEGSDLDRFRELLEYREQLDPVVDRWLRLPVREPEAYFLANGEVVVRGRVRLILADVPFRVVTAPRVSEGRLALDFTEGQIGPLPIPEASFDYLDRELDQLILIGEEYAEVTEIEVTEGWITVSGRWNR